MNELLAGLTSHNLIDEQGNILLESYENGQVQSVGQDIFCILFGDVMDNPSYEALIGDHTFLWGESRESLTYSAAQLGYSKYFEIWHDLGII